MVHNLFVTLGLFVALLHRSDITSLYVCVVRKDIISGNIVFWVLFSNSRKKITIVLVGKKLNYHLIDIVHSTCNGAIHNH